MGDEKFEDESGGHLEESEKELPSTTEALEDQFRVWEESPRDDLDDAAIENQEAETDRSVPDDNRADSGDVRQESEAGRQDKMMLQPEERTPSNLSDDVFERRRRSSSTGPVIFTTPPSQDDLRVEPEVFYEPGRERDDSIPTNEAGASLSTLGENAEDPNKTTNSPGENGRHTGLNGKEQVAVDTQGTDTNSAADAKTGKEKKRKSRFCVLL